MIALSTMRSFFDYEMSRVDVFEPVATFVSGGVILQISGFKFGDNNFRKGPLALAFPFHVDANKNGIIEKRVKGRRSHVDIVRSPTRCPVPLLIDTIRWNRTSSMKYV